MRQVDADITGYAGGNTRYYISDSTGVAVT